MVKAKHAKTPFQCPTNPEKKYPRISVRLAPSTLERLVTLAKKHGKKKSELARFFIIERK